MNVRKDGKKSLLFGYIGNISVDSRHEEGKLINIVYHHLGNVSQVCSRKSRCLIEASFLLMEYEMEGR